MPEQWKVDSLKNRRKNFVMEIISKESGSQFGMFLSFPEENEIVLKVSHNGRQFQCISLLPEEVDKVIEALTPYGTNAVENQK